MIALPIALAHVVALVCFGNDQIVCLKNRRDVAREVARVIALVCLFYSLVQRPVFSGLIIYKVVNSGNPGNVTSVYN